MVEQLSVLDEGKTTVDVEVDTSGFQVKGWNILVQPISIGEKTKGGIYLPEKFKDDMSYLSNVCRVVQKGSLAYTQDMFKGEVWCEVGDFVMIPRNTGQKMMLKGVPVTIVGCDKVIAVVEDPATIDPKFNIG